MTEKHEIKRIEKLKQSVVDFLNDHRYSDDTEEKPTHQSWGNVVQGRFYIDKKNMKTFVNLYANAITNGVSDFSITEVQKEYSPIIVDIDLKAPNENFRPNQRLYNDEMVLNIMQKYLDAINMFLNASKEELKICLLEKKHSTITDDIIKDGFHLIFPDTCVNTKIRHLIRHKVVKMCEDENMFDTFLEGADKVIDKAVVSSNGWFLYGSKKPSGQTYVLKKIYDHDLNVTYDHDSGIFYDVETGSESENKYCNADIITYLSIHHKKKRYSKKNATNIIEGFADSDIEAEFSKLGIDTSSRVLFEQFERTEAKEDLIRRACKYTCMLSVERSTDYENWRNVGLALHNTDDSLLPTWIEFSSKSSKFKRADDGQGNCGKFWKQFKTPSTGSLLTIRSLAYWAKEDNPKEYEAFNREEFKNVLKKSLDKSTYSLAKAFHAKFSDRFVCSSTKTNLWWEFKNHRWNRIDDAYTIKILLSEDFANEYNNEILSMTLKATKSSGIEKEETQAKISRLSEIVVKLMNITHKKNIIEDAKPLFYDPKFEEKLDSNEFLIGFQNGIYDLEHGHFRDGRPDDYMHNNTGYDYRKYSEKMPYKINIDRFFEQILPNKNVRDFFKIALSTSISGETKEEKLYILTGSGSNGKSLTVDLMINALGDYYMSCPITMITRKRGQSNETSPEKVRMKGRRFGVFQETDDGEKLNVGIMKEFTGGDKVLVRDLFKGSNEMIEYKPQMKYFLTCNQLPTVPSNDDGTWRRLRVIEFGSKFTDNPTKLNEFKMDKNLKQEIKKWGPSFMSYLINIYQNDYKDKLLIEPSEVMASTNQYKMENDFYTEYLMDRIIQTTNVKDTISKETLWDAFRTWFKTNYEGKPPPKKIEFHKMASKLFESNKCSRYVKVIFSPTEDNEEDIEPKNELDV